MNIAYTENQKLLKNPKYKIIVDNLEILFKSTGNQFFFGNCVGACDILQQVLMQAGLKCTILECQVSVVKNTNGEKQFFFVGFDGQNLSSSQIDTHTVLIVEDDVPILIDISIGYVFLPEDRVLIDLLPPTTDPKLIGEFNVAGTQLIYKQKQTLRFPSIHQKNLIQRIVSEQNTEKTIKFLKTLIICAVTVGLINFILNISLIVMRLYDITWVG